MWIFRDRQPRREGSSSVIAQPLLFKIQRLYRRRRRRLLFHLHQILPPKNFQGHLWYRRRAATAFDCVGCINESNSGD